MWYAQLKYQETFSALVQEIEPTGVNESEGKFFQMWNEFKDDQRLVNSLKDVECHESQVLKITHNLKLFLYSNLLGMCSHLASTLFFNDPANPDCVKLTKTALGFPAIVTNFL